jgi:phosphoglycolate phosphatase-like HAD superfamily hydrolase
VREQLREVTGSSLDFKPIFPTLATVLANDPAMVRKAFEIIDRYETAAAPSARLYEGSLNLLSRLSEKHVISLVTLQGKKACSQIMERFSLKQFFLNYITREDSMDRAEQVSFALSAMKVGKDSSMFVGDRLNDLNAAKVLGVPFTLIRTHGQDPQDDIPIYHTLAEFSAAILPA